MKSKILGFLSGAVLSLASTVTFASPVCTESFNLGVMGPPAIQLIGNVFTSISSNQDCYGFSLAGTADTFGFLLSFDGSPRRDIDLVSISLYSGDSLLMEDPSPSSFSFSNLAAGNSYVLLIASEVTGLNGGLLGGGLVGYGGAFLTTASSGNPVVVPEPATMALFGAGLAVAWFAKRGAKNRSQGGLRVS